VTNDRARVALLPSKYSDLTHCVITHILHIYMAPNLRDTIQQTRPFGSPAQEAALAIVRAAADLWSGVEKLMKPFGITATQYNVLRILRGAGAEGLCRNDIIVRMITPMPDVTRLIDRLEESGLVVRSRDTEDRRMVSTRVTDRGLELLATLDPLVLGEHERQMADLAPEERHALIALLERVQR
jgi:DNA-binding MarR family transcriptional regulator